MNKASIEIILIASLCLLSSSASSIAAAQSSRELDLFTAVKKKDYPRMRELLRAGVSPNVLDHNKLTPAAFAVAASDIKALRIIHEHGGKLNIPLTASKHTIVYWACLKNSDHAVLRFILANWPTPVLGIYDINASLLKSSFNGNSQAVETLLIKGADVNSKDSRNITPLQMTTSTKVARVLIRRGANLNSISSDGATALHGAAYDGNYALTRLLVSCGAKVNILDAQGNNELHTLVIGYQRRSELQYVKVCRYLVEKGASITTRNKEGLTPSDLARKLGKESLAHVLRQR